MIKRERLVIYIPLCIALLLHLILGIVLFFLQDHGPTDGINKFTEDAPVIFDERGEAGTPIGTPEGTEVVRDADAVQQEDTGPSDDDAQEGPTEEPDSLPIQQATEAGAPELPQLVEPAITPRDLPRGPVQPDVPIEYAPAQVPSDTAVRPRKRAAWHSVHTSARTRAASLNISKHVRTFTDAQYDAYGTPDGTGGSTDYGTGTGGGGSAAYHANANSLDLIKQSYIRKLVRAVVAQSNYMKLLVSTPYAISKTVTWKIIIGVNAKVESIEKGEETHHSLDNAISKIIYATQLPPLPSRFKERFVFYARFQLQHSGELAPLILHAALD